MSTNTALVTSEVSTSRSSYVRDLLHSGSISNKSESPLQRDKRLSLNFQKMTHSLRARLPKLAGLLSDVESDILFDEAFTIVLDRLCLKTDMETLLLGDPSSYMGLAHYHFRHVVHDILRTVHGRGWARVKDSQIDKTQFIHCDDLDSMYFQSGSDHDTLEASYNAIRVRDAVIEVLFTMPAAEREELGNILFLKLAYDHSFKRIRQTLELNVSERTIARRYARTLKRLKIQFNLNIADELTRT